MDIIKLLEFDQVRNKWKEFAVTESALDKIDSITYCLSESELRKNMQDTTDARNL